MGRIFAGYTSALQVALIVIERCIATVNMSSYEKTSHALFVLITIFCTYLSGVGAAYLIYDSNETLIYSCIGMFFVIAFVAITFHATKIISQRQLANSKRSSQFYTLSQRFQLQENLRMIKILKRIMYSFVTCVSMMIGCFLTGVFMLGDPFGTEIYALRGSINLLVTVNANLIVVAAITSMHSNEEKGVRNGRTATGINLLLIYTRKETSILNSSSKPGHKLKV
ncbi:Serpentine Receptor, class E [Aphelenchoides bicaudatus]|nr:Serpentine Receptor, class E [Aphelenchoides bicaudatus]